MNSLINQLIKDGYLKTDAVIEAFSDINRMDFLSSDLEREAYADIALPIGFGQTISQPATVAIMLELLDVKRDQNVLDIGSGSGWTTALLACIVGEKGKITAVERIKELMEWGKANAEKYDLIQTKKIVEFYMADGNEGFPSNAPYDRILVSASAKSIPIALKDQLKIGGKMVIPMRDGLIYLEKKSENDFYEEKYPGFTFVPLVGN